MDKRMWTCPKCKGQFPYTEPVIIDGMKGYKTGIHGCGEGYRSMRLRPGSKDAKAFWDNIRGWLFGGSP